MRAICRQCGTQFADSETPPPTCPICEDDRQFVGWGGQAWTDLAELRRTHSLEWRNEDGVLGFEIKPHFAIGQRALLIQDVDGCILWDCVSLVTPEAVEQIKALGGLRAIAISHPHFYTAMGEWSDAFGGVPIHLHEEDRRWVMRPHPAIVHWSGDTHRLSPTMTLIRCGGHFPGATVLHWRNGAGGRGAIFVGDVAQVAMDRRHVSFMWSYPNLVPLDAPAILAIEAALAPFAFDRIYGGFRNRNVWSDGRVAFDRSVARYLEAIGGA